MKKIIIATFLSVLFLAGIAQEKEEKTKKEIKAEQKARVKENLEKMLKNRDFVFNATDMLPRGGGTMNLGYDFDVQVKNDTVICYLPFIGKSYNVTYGDHNQGFDFTAPVENFKLKDKRKGFEVDMDVNNGTDRLNFKFHITDLGSSTLTLASSKRQSIAYYGTIDPVK